MPLTHDFKVTLHSRGARDVEFRTALLREGIEAMLAGDANIGKAILLDYITAAMAFERLNAENGT